MKRKVKDDWSVAPSSSLVKRLVGSLESSYDIIERYFPHNSEENEYMDVLGDMIEHFKNY